MWNSQGQWRPSWKCHNMWHIRRMLLMLCLLSLPNLTLLTNTAQECQLQVLSCPTIRYKIVWKSGAKTSIHFNLFHFILFCYFWNNSVTQKAKGFRVSQLYSLMTRQTGLHPYESIRDIIPLFEFICLLRLVRGDQTHGPSCLHSSRLCMLTCLVKMKATFYNV